MKRRILKKDLWALTDTLLVDCFNLLVHFPNADHDQVNSLIDDSIDTYNEFRDRANHPDGKDNPKLVKAYYKQLVNDAHKEYHALYKRCNEIFSEAMEKDMK